MGDEGATANALAGVEVAYYLVHSMAAGGGFREVDLRLATTFGRAAAQAGVGRIIYVGALGDAPSSAHLASRHEVGSALAAAGVAVIELRAAVVFGSGSISFEMLRYLTERLPAMVCPRWVRTRIQPVALVDLLGYLEQSLHVAPGIYEIGGADVTTYREMISAYASVRGLRPRRIIDIPWLTPHLSSYWVDLVTPVDRSVSHALIESLVTEVVVVDPEPTRRAFSVTPMGVETRLAAALDDQDEEVSSLAVPAPERPGRRRLLRRGRCRNPTRSRGRGRSRSGDDRWAASAGTALRPGGRPASSSGASWANAFDAAGPRPWCRERLSTGGASPGVGSGELVLRSVDGSPVTPGSDTAPVKVSFTR